MKIAYLLITADAGAGTERTIITQANGMARRGHQVEIISVFRDLDVPQFRIAKNVRYRFAVDRRHRGPETPAPSQLIPAAWDVQFSKETDRALPRLLMNCDADIVIPSTPPLAALAVQFLPERCRIVQQEHRATQLRGDTRLPLDRFISEVDCLVSLTEASRSWIAEHYGARAPRLEVIPNSIPRDFRPQASCLEKRVIAAGRLVNSKRLDHLIGAFSLALPSAPDWTLRIYGSGPRRGALHRRIDSLGLTGKVEIVPNVTDMLREWPKGSIVGLSSQTEGLPMVGLEGIAAGLPFVAYDCPTGPADIIIDGYNGRLVPNGNQEALGAALAELMTDDALRVQMGANAFASADRFDEENVNDRWEALFSDLLASPRHSSDATDTGSSSTDPATSPAVEPTPADLADMEPAAQREANHRLVLQALADLPILCRDIPLSNEARTRIAVPEDQRPAVLAALASADIPGAAIAASSAETSPYPPSVFAERSAQVPRLLFFRELSNPLASYLQCSDFGCEVEFWTHDEEREQTFIAPGNNRLADHIAVGHDPLDERPSNRSLWDEVDFPIDAVFTWVDGSDPEWLDRKRDRLAAGSWPELSVSAIRFQDREELRYSLRSIHSYAPWIRTIYVVTDQQQPSWLTTADPRIQLVDHREIFPDATALPTFNSHAIETCLHHIDGLAEHFLYFNDDIIVRKYLDKSAFFTSSGLARFFPSPTKLNYIDDHEPHIAAGINNRRLLGELFAREISNGMLHTPHPHRRSVLYEIEERFPDEIAATRNNPFRGEHDISLLSSFAQYYGYFTGRAVPSQLHTRYFQVTSHGLKQARWRLRDQSTEIYGFGECAESTSVDEGLERELAALMHDIVPFPSPFEVPPTR